MGWCIGIAFFKKRKKIEEQMRSLHTCCPRKENLSGGFLFFCIIFGVFNKNKFVYLFFKSLLFSQKSDKLIG
jgi:hypothetical protein